MPNRETAPVALFHVRLRPLSCKQLRASLFALSGWALVYISLSPQRNLCGWHSTEVATVFFSKCLPNFFLFMHASFLSPLPIFRGPFLLLSSAVPLSGPYWEDRDRHSAPPKVCLPVWSALVLNKSPQTLPHTQQSPQNMSTRESQTLPVCPLCPLSHISSLLHWQRSFDTSLLCTVGVVWKLAASKAGLLLSSDPTQMRITGLTLYRIFLRSVTHSDYMNNRHGWKCVFCLRRWGPQVILVTWNARINVIKNTIGIMRHNKGINT